MQPCGNGMLDQCESLNFLLLLIARTCIVHPMRCATCGIVSAGHACYALQLAGIPCVFQLQAEEADNVFSIEVVGNSTRNKQVIYLAGAQAHPPHT